MIQSKSSCSGWDGLGSSLRRNDSRPESFRFGLDALILWTESWPESFQFRLDPSPNHFASDQILTYNHLASGLNHFMSHWICAACTASWPESFPFGVYPSPIYFDPRHWLSFKTQHSFERKQLVKKITSVQRKPACVIKIQHLLKMLVLLSKRTSIFYVGNQHFLATNQRLLLQHQVAASTTIEWGANSAPEYTLSFGLMG